MRRESGAVARCRFLQARGGRQVPSNTVKLYVEENDEMRKGRTMKKTISMILLLCMVFALAACGGSQAPAATEAPAAEAPAEAPAAETPAAE